MPKLTVKKGDLLRHIRTNHAQAKGATINVNCLKKDFVL